MQFLSKFHRFSLTFGFGGMVVRLFATVGTRLSLKKLAAGPDGIYKINNDFVIQSYLIHNVPTIIDLQEYMTVCNPRAIIGLVL